MVLDHLPRASHFRQAAADDEEWAEEILDAEDVSEVAEPPSVPLSEFSREVELMTVMAELLQSLNANIRATAGDKNPPKVRPLPRPRTAVDRVRDRRRDARLASLVSEVEAAMQRWTQNHN